MKAFQSLINQLRLSYPTRASQLDALEKAEFPDSKTDGWRYTELADLYATDWTMNTSASANGAPFKSLTLSVVDSCVVIGVNNGELSAPTILPDGIELKSEDADCFDLEAQKSNSFLVLNQLGRVHAVKIKITSSFTESRPIHIAVMSTVPVGTDSAIFPHINLIVEAGVQAKVMITFESPDGVRLLCDSMFTVNLERDAKLHLLEFQKQGSEVFHLSTNVINLKHNSQFSCMALSLGSQFSRHDLRVTMLEENAGVSIKGLYLVDGNRFADFQTQVLHLASSCTSEQVFKGVLSGQAKANFDGLIHICETTEKSVALQINRNMLLSQDASVHASPSLEIYADDVKCSHGCTIGQLDEDQVFFLRSRGIPENETRALLTFAFANDIVQHDEELYGLKPYVEECINKLNVSSTAEGEK